MEKGKTEKNQPKNPNDDSVIDDETLAPSPEEQFVFTVSRANDSAEGAQQPGLLGTVSIHESLDALEEQHSTEDDTEFEGANLGARLAQRLAGIKIESPHGVDDKEDKTGPQSKKTEESGESKKSHPKGTYFQDGERHIDYVLVYEHSHRPRSLTHTVQNLRRLARGSSNTVVSGLMSVFSSGAADATMNVAGCDAEQRREFFLSQLLKSGLALEMQEYHEKGDGKDRKLVFVKLHAPWSVLLREAERLRMKLPLLLTDRDATRRRSEDQSRSWFSFSCLEPKLDDDEAFDDSPVDFDEHIAWPFSNDQIDRFDLSSNPGSLFAPCRRSEIVWEVLQSTRSDPQREKRRGVESLLEHSIFEAAFPLHDGDYEYRQRVASKTDFTTRQRLHAQWATARAAFRPQPLNRIRNYFSEKVAFYFAFMDFYSKMLIVPSLFGLVAFLYGLIISWTANRAELEDVCEPADEPGKYVMCPICQPPACDPYLMADEGCERAYWQYRLDNITAFITASLNVLWCAFFVKFWRRREARLAVEWGTYEAQDGVRVVRPDYEKRATTQKRNAVTDELEPHVHRYKQVLWRAASILVTFAILCTAVSCLAALIATRVTLYGVFKELGGVFRKRNIDIARWIQHGFMFVMVTVFEAVYHRVAEYLTKLECPKTMSGYLSSLLWKVFIFVHLVDFLPIAYAAWFKGRFWTTPTSLNAITEMCEAGGCMNEVVELVAVLLLLRLIVQNIAEVAWPAIKAAWARFKTQRRGVRRNMRDSVKHSTRWSQFFKDYHLSELQLDGVSPEYMEMMIQFSFVAFFVPALPLVPLICLINNVVEIRVDAINFLASHRRPSPARVPGIQIWNKFMNIIAKLAVVVNAALLAFTSEIVPRIFHEYDNRNPHSSTFVEYLNSSISWQPVREWKRLEAYLEEGGPSEEGAEGGESSIFNNLTRCAYFGYRHPDPPHSLTSLFFQIMTARVFAFAIFIIVFYFLTYLINSTINDVPKDVRNTIRRRQHLVTRALEEEAFRKRAGTRDVETISRQISNDTLHEGSSGTTSTVQQLSVGDCSTGGMGEKSPGICAGDEDSEVMNIKL